MNIIAVNMLHILCLVFDFFLLFLAAQAKRSKPDFLKLPSKIIHRKKKTFSASFSLWHVFKASYSGVLLMVGSVRLKTHFTKVKGQIVKCQCFQLLEKRDWDYLSSGIAAHIAPVMYACTLGAVRGLWRRSWMWFHVYQSTHTLQLGMFREAAHFKFNQEVQWNVSQGGTALGGGHKSLFNATLSCYANPDQSVWIRAFINIVGICFCISHRGDHHVLVQCAVANLVTLEI